MLPENQHEQKPGVEGQSHKEEPSSGNRDQQPESIQLQVAQNGVTEYQMCLYNPTRCVVDGQQPSTSRGRELRTQHDEHNYGVPSASISFHPQWGHDPLLSAKPRMAGKNGVVNFGHLLNGISQPPKTPNLWSHTQKSDHRNSRKCTTRRGRHEDVPYNEAGGHRWRYNSQSGGMKEVEAHHGGSFARFQDLHQVPKPEINTNAKPAQINFDLSKLKPEAMPVNQDQDQDKIIYKDNRKVLEILFSHPQRAETMAVIEQRDPDLFRSRNWPEFKLMKLIGGQPSVPSAQRVVVPASGKPGKLWRIVPYPTPSNRSGSGVQPTAQKQRQKAVVVLCGTGNGTSTTISAATLDHLKVHFQHLYGCPRPP